MALLHLSEPGQSPAPHQNRLAIGIDLGTTHSLVAALRHGMPECLPDLAGRVLFPSAIHYNTEGGREIGDLLGGEQALEELVRGGGAAERPAAGEVPGGGGVEQAALDGRGGDGPHLPRGGEAGAHASPPRRAHEAAPPGVEPDGTAPGYFAMGISRIVPLRRAGARRRPRPFGSGGGRDGHEIERAICVRAAGAFDLDRAMILRGDLEHVVERGLLAVLEHGDVPRERDELARVGGERAGVGSGEPVKRGWVVPQRFLVPALVYSAEGVAVGDVLRGEHPLTGRLGADGPGEQPKNERGDGREKSIFHGEPPGWLQVAGANAP